MNRHPVFSALLICGTSGAVFSVLRAPLPWLMQPARVAFASRNLPVFLAFFFRGGIMVKFAPYRSEIRLAAVSVRRQVVIARPQHESTLRCRY